MIAEQEIERIEFLLEKAALPLELNEDDCDLLLEVIREWRGLTKQVRFITP